MSWTLSEGSIGDILETERWEMYYYCLIMISLRAKSQTRNIGQPDTNADSSLIFIVEKIWFLYFLFSKNILNSEVHLKLK